MNWQLLTPTEQRIAYMLGNVSNDTMIGMGINISATKMTVETFHEMAGELIQMCERNPGAMSKVIGWELVDLLLNHNPCAISS